MSGKREAGSGKRLSVIPSVARDLGRCVKLLAALALFALPASAQTHLVIVSGLGGEKKYVDSFNKLAANLATAANQKLGLSDASIQWFSEDAASTKPFYKGQATKVNIERALGQLATKAGAGDQIVFVLIGHGSGERDDTKISLPGPDLNARDFASILGRFSTQKVAFVNLTSASGDMLPVVSAPNRVVITATKSAFERNESRFAEYFVDALSKDVADTDKDGRISLFEAYKYAIAETKRFYETDSRLQTEHSQLDDMGAKEGVADPDGRSGQGALARRFFLDAGMGGGPARAVVNDAQLAGLYKDKYALEERIEALRAKKTTMTATAYDDALEDLLVQLARKARSIREIEGRKS